MNKELTITIRAQAHRGQACYFFYFPISFIVQDRLRSISGVRYSASNKAWYVPARADVLVQLREKVADIAGVQEENLNVTEVRAEVSAVLVVKDENTNEKKHLLRKKHTPFLGKPLTEAQAEKMERFKKWMKAKRYGESTIKTYAEALKTFLHFCVDKETTAISNEDITEFNNQYILAQGLSQSFQNQVINAIKLFYRVVELKQMDPALIYRPRREKKLPNVLSKEEVRAILGALRNQKHKAMLSLIYSCGLRRSELINLKIKDIDSNRGLIIIRQAKGKKDRVVPLSEKILLMLREYFTAYKPKEWLFEGQSGQGQYDESSLAAVLRQAVEKCKIEKPVTLHWLRHSYATHLLENGTDLRYIQEILGHSRSTTTEIYTHVSNKSIQKVISPFDTL